MLLKNKKAQSIVEYTIILVIVMGAFLTMGNYMKRGIQGRWKMATDGLGDQYDPRAADSMVEIRQVVNSSTAVFQVPSGGLGNYSFREDFVQIVETKNGVISVGSISSDN